MSTIINIFLCGIRLLTLVLNGKFRSDSIYDKYIIIGFANFVRSLISSGERNLAVHLLCLGCRKSKCCCCSVTANGNCEFLSYRCSGLRSVGPIKVVNSRGYILCSKGNSNCRVVESQTLTEFLNKIQIGEFNAKIARINRINFYVNSNLVGDATSSSVLQVHIASFSSLVTKGHLICKRIASSFSNLVAISCSYINIRNVPIICAIYCRK